MRQRRRTLKREEKRAKKRQAADLRREHDLCKCADDERYYPTQTEADADKEPMKACGECGKERLIVKVISGAFAKSELGGMPLDVAAPAVIQGILR